MHEDLQAFYLIYSHSLLHYNYETNNKFDACIKMCERLYTEYITN